MESEVAAALYSDMGAADVAAAADSDVVVVVGMVAVV